MCRLHKLAADDNTAYNLHCIQKSLIQNLPGTYDIVQNIILLGTTYAQPQILKPHTCHTTMNVIGNIEHVKYKHIHTYIYIHTFLYATMFGLISESSGTCTSFTSKYLLALPNAGWIVAGATYRNKRKWQTMNKSFTAYTYVLYVHTQVNSQTSIGQILGMLKIRSFSL